MKLINNKQNKPAKCLFIGELMQQGIKEGLAHSFHHTSVSTPPFFFVLSFD